MATDSRSRPKAPTIKDSIAFVCKALGSVGLTTFVPEDFRQAKYDGPVGRKLWRALHDLCIIDALSGDRSTGARLDDFWSTAALEAAGDEPLPPGACSFVTGCLWARGYPRGAVFSEVAEEVRPREVLLAFVWLVGQSGLLVRALDRKIGAALLPAQLPPYPEDIIGSPLAAAAGAEGEDRARALFDRILSSQNSGSSGGASPSEAVWDEARVRAHHAQILSGKVRTAAGSISSLQAARYKQLASLHSLQQQLGHREALSPFELGLAMDPGRLAEYGRAMDAAEQALAMANDFQRHLRNFFQWAEDLLAEAGPSEGPPPGAAPLSLLPRLAARDPSPSAVRERAQVLGPAAIARLRDAVSVAPHEAGALLARLQAKTSESLGRMALGAGAGGPSEPGLAAFLALDDFRSAAIDTHPGIAAGNMDSLASSPLGVSYGSLVPEDVAAAVAARREEVRAEGLVGQSLSDKTAAVLPGSVVFRPAPPRDKAQKTSSALQGKNPYAASLPPAMQAKLPSGAAAAYHAAAEAPSPTAMASYELERLKLAAVDAAAAVARVRDASRSVIEEAVMELEGAGIRVSNPNQAHYAF